MELTTRFTHKAVFAGLSQLVGVAELLGLDGMAAVAGVAGLEWAT